MLELGIAKLHVNPSILNDIDNVAKIVNKKQKDVKGYFIPVAYYKYIEDGIKEIEYQQFLKRNRSLADCAETDDTILDGLDDAY